MRAGRAAVQWEWISYSRDHEMQGDNKLLGEDKGRCHSRLAGERDGKNERFCLMRGWCSEMTRFGHNVARNTSVIGEQPRLDKESQNNSS